MANVDETIAVVIPAFNEEQRLPEYLTRIERYLKSTYTNRHSVIVVDDGSFDRTAEIVRKRALFWPDLRLIQNERNTGKGSAVRVGVLAAVGDLILITDADGATSIDQERELREAMQVGVGGAIGSRSTTRATRTRLRGIAGRLFAFLVSSITGLRYRDTQCGFKLFRCECCKRIFRHCKENGFLIDVEALLYASSLGVQIVEVPVVWSEVCGSKIALIKDGTQMLLNLVKLTWRFRRRSTAICSAWVESE